MSDSNSNRVNGAAVGKAVGSLRAEAVVVLGPGTAGVTKDVTCFRMCISDTIRSTAG